MCNFSGKHWFEGSSIFFTFKLYDIFMSPTPHYHNNWRSLYCSFHIFFILAPNTFLCSHKGISLRVISLGSFEALLLCWDKQNNTSKCSYLKQTCLNTHFVVKILNFISLFYVLTCITSFRYLSITCNAFIAC